MYFTLLLFPRWLRQQFLKADKERDGVLSYGEVQDLLEHMNIKLSPKYAKKIFNVITAILFRYILFDLNINFIFRPLIPTRKLKMVNKY